MNNPPRSIDHWIRRAKRYRRLSERDAGLFTARFEITESVRQKWRAFTDRFYKGAA